MAATPPFTLAPPAGALRLRSPHPVSPALDLGGMVLVTTLPLPTNDGGEEPGVRVSRTGGVGGASVKGGVAAVDS